MKSDVASRDGDPRNARGSSLITRHSSRFAAVTLLALWPAITLSQAPAGPAIDKEFSRQDAIYQTRGENVPDGYVTDRSLLAYGAVLPAGFDRSLAGLGAADRWLDIGAGEGKAILDYYTPRYDSMNPGRRGKKARAVAMSIEDRRTDRWSKTAASLDPGQIHYLSGKRMREYSPEELGKFQLITDLTGGFSYSRFISVFIERTLGALELNGMFYTMLLDVLPESSKGPSAYPDTLLLTEIQNADGSSGRVCSWLKRISCVEVACEPDAKSERPVELYRMRKTCEKIAVPPLELVFYKAGTPPQRRFQVRPFPVTIDE